MNIITLRRKLWLYRQIHKLNELDTSLIANGWNDKIALECKVKYYDINDIWLKFLSLPAKSFDRVLRLSLLLLISTDKTLLISGKKLQVMHQMFTQYELSLAKLHSDMLVNLLNSIPQVTPNIFFAMNNNILDQASLALIIRVYDSNKHKALEERYRLRFAPYLLADAEVVGYINSFKVTDLEQTILKALALLMPHLMS